jgi:RimJ/RimL family protein N-acetyltransferase
MEQFFLQTDRFKLRPFIDADVPFLVELNSDPDVIRYTGEVAFSSIEAAKRRLDILTSEFLERKMGRFVVTDLESGERLGWCGLKWLDDFQVVDLGYRFFRRHWGKGIASETAPVCLSYGFRKLFLSEIFAYADLQNIASVRVLEKCGFKRIGPSNHHGIEAEGFVISRQKYEELHGIASG